MKRVLVILMACLMLLTSCGGAIDDTSPVTDDAIITEPTATDTLEAPETEEPQKIERDDFSISVKDDTYVLNNDSSGNRKDDNFNGEAIMDVKTTGGSLTRYGYVKFDISELAGNTDFTCIDLDLTVFWRQVDNTTSEHAKVEIYGCNTDWSEGTVTFNTQPQEYGLVSVLDDVTAATETRSFPVTAYVRSALNSGATEVAFKIVEITDECDIRIQFHTKEGDAEKAARLSVYHGTKVDSSDYIGDTGSSSQEPSKNGLDAILGASDEYNEEIRLDPVEDTYVEAGTSAEKNFGSAAHLDFKASSGVEDSYYRITLLKFDVSALKDVEFSNAELMLNCTVIENENIPTALNVYKCFAYDWDENTVTFKTRPEREDLVTSTTVFGVGLVRIDVTDYVKRVRDSGQQYVSFWLEGDKSTLRRLNFSSKESGEGTPTLIVGNGSDKIDTTLKYSGENPWEYAMENVSEWLDRWEQIKKGGDTDVSVIEKDSAEYTLTVGATRNPNGANTKYTSYPTRNISTLKGYTPSTAETAKYDVYGGLMDDSVKQEATGFFYTKKIGDRWWTIDPLGYPFYRAAVVAIGTGSGIQYQSFMAKYGSASNWVSAISQRLWELGYNSTGGWSTMELINAEKPLAQTNIVYALKKYCQGNGLDISKSGNTTLLHGILPVFDPDFVTSADKTVKAAVAKYNTSAFIYGWMGDNELPASLGMLENSLFADTADERFSYTYATAWTFIYLKTGKTSITAAELTDDIRREYRAMVYDRYFKVVCEALDRYAPYHQFLGCRFVDGCFKDEYVMRVAGYWCDVISYNYYGVWEPDAELIANQQRWAGKPFIITEWYAKGMDVWEKDNRMTNESGAGWTVRDQDDRGRFYQNYVLQLLECKGCVGFDWFQFLDNDPDNLSADESNRNANKGIFDNYANEYTVLTSYMKEINDQKYNLISFFDAR